VFFLPFVSMRCMFFSALAPAAVISEDFCCFWPVYPADCSSCLEKHSEVAESTCSPNDQNTWCTGVAPTCAATVTSDQDCDGADVGSTAASSIEECCSACSELGGCGAFVFVDAGDYAGCYLKSHCVPTSGCASGRCSAGAFPPSPTPAGSTIGYWDTTWSEVSAPVGATLSVAFSGWNNPKNALDESNAVKHKMVGDKWIDAGGGDIDGRWNKSWIKKWETEINTGGLSDWDGIVLDIEECFEVGLSSSFARLLRAAKAAGLSTIVTVSGSAPYMCDDSEELMKTMLANEDVDILSPQCYDESGPPTFTETDNSKIKWTDWVGSHGRFVPSLTKPQIENGDYEKTVAHFQTLGIETSGYILWPTAASKAARRTGPIVV